MKRFLFTLAASLVLAGTVPATALARHHHHHHGRTHHARVRRFGDPNTQATTASPASSDNAGTVQSFSGGVLTIVLNDASHTTVSGMVTNDTELECEAAEAAQSSTVHQDGDGGSGGDQSGSGEDQATQGEDENATEAVQNCTTASLTPGTAVHEAELRLTGAGAVWSKVELVTSSTSSGSSGTDD